MNNPIVIAIISAGLSAFVTCTFQMSNKFIDMKKEKRDKEEEKIKEQPKSTSLLLALSISLFECIIPIYTKSFNSCCKRCRVKNMRLFTVPKGRPNLSAISRYLNPDTCIEKGTLYSLGNALTIRCISFKS